MVSNGGQPYFFPFMPRKERGEVAQIVRAIMGFQSDIETTQGERSGRIWRFR